MTEEQIRKFFTRIDQITPKHKPRFGKMNANQMVCHCTDFFRMAKGSKIAQEYEQINSNVIISLARSGKPIQAPKGFGQVEGEGTMTTDLENDKKILKNYILEFSGLPRDFNFALHPYFGEITRKRWIGLAIYHLDHHLGQFNV